MKTAIYSPYLDTLGGGEKYMMTIAEILLKNGFLVDILLDKHLLDFKELKSSLEKRFNLNLSSANFTGAPIGKGSDFFSRFIFLKKYDVLFYLTDGSIFYPTAKKNILHIQSPLIGQPAKSTLGKIKLKGWDLIIYNSKFTQKYAKDNWPIKSKVVYPPIDIKKIEPLKKEKYILSVGRFFGFLKDKKHSILIKTFRNLYTKKKIKDWSFYLVGSASKGDTSYVNELKKLSRGLPIIFYPNLNYDRLIQVYGKSSIYWHASGYGENNPTKMEHFGISTVEAMAAGSVPVVIGKGGQVEIVDDGKNGFLWNNLSELENKSLQLMDDDKLRIRMSQEAVKKAADFDKSIFEAKIKEIVNI
ncbi:MAG: glycosyltransferase family 4 protein [Candidatus Daviesbacteria bacterium]|nr:glycosyltransferase family 4 protein [Candidatus Daviesbacteria bacterium]